MSGIDDQMREQRREWQREQAEEIRRGDQTYSAQDALRIAMERFKGQSIQFLDNDAEVARMQELHDKAELERAMEAAETSMGKPPVWWTAAKWESKADGAGIIPYSGLKHFMLDLCAGVEPPKNVIIMGPTDSGKTHAAVAIGRILAGKGMTVCRETEPELADHYNTHKYRRAELLAQRKQEAIQAGVLIWDDLGKIQLANGKMLTEFGSYVFTIFDKRAERRRLNIVTTRYETFEELAAVVGSDLLRRIRQNENMDKSRSAVFTYTKGRV